MFQEQSQLYPRILSVKEERRFREFIQKMSRQGLPAEFRRGIEKICMNRGIFGYPESILTGLNSADVPDPEAVFLPDQSSRKHTACEWVCYEAERVFRSLWLKLTPLHARRIGCFETEYQGGAPGRQPPGTLLRDIFTAAAAMYVSTRLAFWWMTLCQLSGMMLQIDRGEAFRHPEKHLWITRIRKAYNQNMAEPVDAYREKGFRMFQNERKRRLFPMHPLSLEMKYFLDHMIFSGAVPNDFEQVMIFKEIVSLINTNHGINFSACRHFL